MAYWPTVQAAPTSPLDGLKLEPVGDDNLKKLRSEGIQVFPLVMGSPFLQVLFQDKKDLTTEQLRKLQPIGKNIVQLNLAGSNMDDAMLAAVAKDMPHLNRLYLEQTAITDKGLAALSNLQYLEYLNLYKTQVTDAGLARLQKLPQLRSLYLWKPALHRMVWPSSLRKNRASSWTRASKTTPSLERWP